MKNEILFSNDYLAQGDDLISGNRRLFKIIHFNDVYNIESRDVEPVGGASRFKTLVDNLIQESNNAQIPIIVLFSGDAFNPSTLSVLKGRPMARVLNELRINCACIGNHDFDFGVDHLQTLIESTNFPWLLSNAFDAKTNRPLANAYTKHILKLSNGIKIGILGLVEEEWMATLSTIDYDEIIFQDFIQVGQKLAHELKEQDKCDLVIALTHMRMYNDELLLQKVDAIDLILGGHDHDYNFKQFGTKFALKSGSDFKELSVLTLIETKVHEIRRFEIDSSVDEHKEIAVLVQEYLSEFEKELDVTLGFMNTELEGRFPIIRTQETNLGNFICDIALESVNADCCLINSGTFRSDTFHPCGAFKVRDLKKILPFIDTLVVIKASGKQLYEALENGVSQYPKLEGRFPQVSGVKFTFNANKPSGSRIDMSSISIQNETIDLKRDYKIATKAFMADGKDGYDMLRECVKLIDEENGPELFTIVENHFKTIDELKLNHNLLHRPSLVPLAKRNAIVNDMLIQIQNKVDVNNNNNNSNPTSPLSSSKKISFQTASRVISTCLKAQKNVIQNIKESDEFKRRVLKYEQESLMLNPKCENRIVILKA